MLHAVSLPKYGLRWDSVLPTAPWAYPFAPNNAPAIFDLRFASESGPLRVKLSTRSEEMVICEATGPSGVQRTSNQRLSGNVYNPGQIALSSDSAESVRVFFLGAFRDVPQAAFSYGSFARDIKPDGSGCWNALHQLKANDDARFIEIQTEIADLGFGVKAVKTPTALAGSGSIRLDNYGRTDSLPFMGSGANSVFPVIVQGSLCESGDTFLVEEPELHLHESALNRLGAFFGKLATRGVQIMMTCHSTVFFGSLFRGTQDGTVPPDTSVFIFDRKPTGETSVIRVSIEDYYRALHGAEDALRRS